MKYKFLLLFFIFTTISFSQIYRTEKYEMYLMKFEENELSLSKGMYMTDKSQTYYQGVIEVTFMDTGNTKNYNYFFSTWDDIYKEFLIKDDKHNIVLPKIEFENQTTATIKQENLSIELENNSTIENSILSSMVIWLDNHVK